MDVTRVVQELGRETGGLVTARALEAAGVSRGRRARAVAAGRLHVVHPRVLALAPLPARPSRLVVDGQCAPEHVLAVRAALLSVGPTSAARSTTAAALLGLELLVEPDEVHLVVPAGRGAVRLDGVDVVRERRASHKVGLRVPGQAPLRLVGPVEVVRGVALERPRAEAVAVTDALLRRRLVTPAALSRAVRAGGALSAPRCRGVVWRSDHRAESLLESLARVLFQDAGLLGWVSQHVVRDAAGRPLQRVDFCWPRERLVVEVDGARYHQDVARDRRRDNELEVLGYRLLRFSWADVVHHPQQVVDAVAACLRRAA